MLTLFSPVRGPFLVLAVVALGCSGGDSFIVPTAGTLDITTATSGVEPDADGYTVQVDDEPADAIGANASLSKTEMSGGTHSVQLAGLAPNCAVAGDNPRSAVVTLGEATAVAFEVTCGATTGALQVTTSTTGDSPDSDGYSLTLDGTDQGAIGVSGAVTIEQLAPGTHVVGLSGIAGNCQLQGDNPQAVIIAAGAAATASFAVVCAPPPVGAGALRITTATTGLDPDRDGYTVAVDDGDGQAMAINAVATLTNMAPGAHSVRLSGVAPNCAIQGENPQAVTVAEGATADVSFAITCSGTTGSIQVTTSTTGAQVDPDGYSIQLDGAVWGTVAASSNATVGRVPAGNHSLGLSGVDPNCAVQGENPRTVTVTAGGSAPVAFEIICTSTTGSLRIVTATTGTSLDADGYTYALDDRPPQPIGVNGDITVERVAAGEHTVKLDGAASNCAVAGDNPRTANITGGATAEVSFAITCAAPAGLRWTEVQSGINGHLYSVWGSAANDVFTLGETGSGYEAFIFRFDGQTWSNQLTEQGTTLYDLWGTAGTNVFAVGYRPLETPHNGVVLRYDGSSWAPMQLPDVDPASDLQQANYQGIWGASSDDIFAVGTYWDGSYWGLVSHYDGSGWSLVQEASGSRDLNLEDIHGSSSTNIFTVGADVLVEGEANAAILRYDGLAWTRLPTGQPEGSRLYGVWVVGPNDAYAVGVQGDAGLILHYDGSAWSPMTVPAIGPLRGVWGSSATDIYAVGHDAILHFDGSSWEKVDDRGGLDVWGSSASDVYVVGVNGRILHGTP